MEALFPTEIITYLELFAPVFSANPFKYFQGFMLGYMLLGQTRKSVTNIARVCFFVDRHISSWERFLCQYPWDLKAIQSRLVTLLREQLGENLLICGAYLSWVDTTLVSKVKGKMPGVQKWHDHSGNPNRGMYLVGHHWALSGLLGVTYLGGEYTPLAFPILSSVISGNTNPVGFTVDSQGVIQAMNFWEAVCPLVTQMLQMLGNHPLRVVADAYFSKAPFINVLLKSNIHLITRMRKDAVGWDDPTEELPLPAGQKKRGRKPTQPKKGKRWKIATLIQHFPSQRVTVFIYGRVQTLCILTRDLWIRDVYAQKVRVVLIKTNKEPIILLSTDLNLLAEQIIQIYALRFSLEISIRDTKQHLGLEDYQSTHLLAITRFTALSLIGFCLWRLMALTNLDAAWLQTKDPVSVLSFTRISRAVRRGVIQSILQSSAWELNFQNSTPVPEELLRLVA